MIEKLYAGRRRADGGVAVTVATLNRDGLVQHIAALAPRRDLCNHSPTGFEWGYGGSGPSQLALAMLADFFGDPEAAALHRPNRDSRMPSATRAAGPERLSKGGAGTRAALDLYHAFRHDVIAEIRADSWEIRSAQVATWVRKQSHENAGLALAGRRT